MNFDVFKYCFILWYDFYIGSALVKFQLKDKYLNSKDDARS